MFSLYDESSPCIFTFPQQFVHLVKMFRQHTLGGICNVYMRHATTIDETAASAAKYNSSGNEFENHDFKLSCFFLFLRTKMENHKFFRREQHVCIHIQ